MSTKSHRSFLIDTDEELDLEVIVHFTYSAGRPQVNYLRNGDPGYPAEPPEFDITEVIREDDGTQLILTEDLMEDLYNKLHEDCGEIEAELEADYADYRYEQYRDEQMMEHYYD